MRTHLEFGGYSIEREFVCLTLWECAVGARFGGNFGGPDIPAIRKLFAEADARKIPLYLDYYCNRVMKVEFDEPLDLRLYVRDNGEQAVKAAQTRALDLATRAKPWWDQKVSP